MASTDSQGRRPQAHRSATAPASLSRFVAHENATPPALRHLTPERPVTTIRESKSVVVLPAHVEIDAEHGPRNIVNLSLGPPSHAGSAPSQRVRSRASTNHSVTRPSSRAARANNPTARSFTPQYTSNCNTPRNYSYPSLAGVLRDPRPCPQRLYTASNRNVGPVVSGSTSYQQPADFERLTHSPNVAATARSSNRRSHPAILDEGAVAPGSPLSRIPPGSRDVAHYGSSSGSERVLYHHIGALTKSTSNIAPKVRSQAASLVGSSPTRSVQMADRYPSPLRRRNISEPILPILTNAQPKLQPRTLMEMRPQHERAPSFRPPPALVDWENDYSRDSVGYTLPEIRERRARLSKHFPQPENAVLTEGRQRRFAGEFRDVPRVITGEIHASRAPEWGSAPGPDVEVVEAHKEGTWRKISGAVAKRFGKKGKDSNETTRSSSDSGPLLGNASSPAKSPRTSDGTSVDAAPPSRKERRARRAEAEHGWQPTAVGSTLFSTQGLSRSQKNPVRQTSPQEPAAPQAQVQHVDVHYWQPPQPTAVLPTPVQRVGKYSRHQPIAAHMTTASAEEPPRLYVRRRRSAAAAALTRIQEDDGDDGDDNEAVLAKLIASGRVDADRIAAFRRQQRILPPNDPEREALENLYGPPDGVYPSAEATTSLPIDGQQAPTGVASDPNEECAADRHSRVELVSPLTDRERELLEQVYGSTTSVSPLTNSSSSLSINDSRAPAVVLSDRIRPQYSVSSLNQQERLQQLFGLREPVSPLTDSSTSLPSIDERLAAASTDMHLEEKEGENAFRSGETAPKPSAGSGSSEPNKEQEHDEWPAPAVPKPTKWEDWDKFDFDLHPPPLVIHKCREPSPAARPISMMSDESLDEVEATAVRFASVGKARLQEIGRPAIVGKGKSRQAVLNAPAPPSQEADRIEREKMRNDSFEAKKVEKDFG